MNFDKETESFKNNLNDTFLNIWNIQPFHLRKEKSLIIESKKVLLTKNNNNNKLYGSFYYSLGLDREEKHLAVKKSTFKFFLNDHSEPLFRFEFEKVKDSSPRAHFHIHLGKDDDLTKKLMSFANNKNPKKQSLPKLHFPMGGVFLRPCLEDVLMALDKDLNLGLTNRDRKILFENIQTYRKIQAKAAYREYLEKDYGKLADLKD